MAITSSNRSKEPSSTTGVDGVSSGLGFRPLGFTAITVFGVVELLGGVGVARGARFPPIFSFRVGVGVAALIDGAGAVGAFMGVATAFA